MFKWLLSLFAVLLLLLPASAFAGRGCCSYHGGQSYCDTSSGRWVCNDGTYSPSCMCSVPYVPPVPVYVPPAPKNPANGQWNYTQSASNWCNYDVIGSWDKGENSTEYSVAISKVPGANPGPLADTSSSSYSFKNINPGRWYVNIRGGNGTRWADGIVYWLIDLPKASPAINGYLTTEGEEQYLNYNISCLDKVEGPKEFIDHLNTSGQSPVGKFFVSYSIPTQITLKGWDKEGKEYSQAIDYKPIEKKPVDNIVPFRLDKDWLILIGIVSFIGWAVYTGAKKTM